MMQAPPPEVATVYDDVYTVGDLHEYAKLVELQDQFNRKLGGCPPRGIGGDCIPRAGVLDLKLWNEIVRQARKVFSAQKDASRGKHQR